MPDWRNEIRKFTSTLNLDPARETEIVEEMAQHLNDKYDEMVAAGTPPEEAYRLVITDLNGGKLITELRATVKPIAHPIVPGTPEKANLFIELWQNLRYGARLLRLSPGFTVIAVLSLALGIGANSAIFQLINAVRLRTLPVENAQELAQVKIKRSSRSGAFIGANPDLTFGLWESLNQHQQAFSLLGAWHSQRLNLSRGGEARYAQTMFVSGRFFETLGVRPAQGRLISASDDQRACNLPVAVLSDSFWRSEFSGRTSALGSKVMLEGKTFDIVGITPASFFGVEVGRNFDVALPLCAEQLVHVEDPYINNQQGWWLGAIGRLKPGWTIEKASSQLAAISAGIFKSTLPAAYDATDATNYLKLVFEALPAGNGVSSLRRNYEKPLWLLLAISGSVLLIACANLANLMVARSCARQKEMAVRLALGASRGKLLRQMLAESLLLASIGALCGAGLAQVLSRVLISLLSTQRTRLFLDLQPDWRVLAFTAILALFTCILFGLMPAIQAARTPPGEAMKANSRGLTAGGNRFGVRQALVISQVALSLVLLVGAFMFVSTFRNLTSLDAGFQQDRILVSNFDLTPLKLPVERRIPYKQQLLERIRSLPGVLSAAEVWILPLSGSGWNEYVFIPDSTFNDIANFNQVSPGYFKTIGTSMLAGRDFNDRDIVGASVVAIVTQTFAKRFFNGANPIGRTFRVKQQEGKPDKIYEIVGFVEDAKYRELREDFGPIVFVPDAQDERPYSESQIVIRSNEALPQLTGSIKQVIADLDPSIVITFTNFHSIIREGLIQERLMATLSGFLGFLAGVLAMVGLYGVIAYMVARRKNEIGLRIALGADKARILKMILREAATLLAAGISVGTFLALIVGGAAKTLLFGLEPNDPFVLIASGAGLGMIALLATFVPAQRAATLNPTQALREE